MLPMFIIIGFRASYIGADTVVYLRHFLTVYYADLDFAIENSRMEAGYIRFVKYVGYLTKSAYTYQIIYTAIYFIGYYSFAKLLERETGFKFVYFVITLGLFYFMLTGVRQNLAISICLFSVQFLHKRKYVIVALLMCLAFTFHKSSLMFVFVILLWNKNLNKKTLILLVAGLIIVSTYLVGFQKWANEQFEYTYGIEETGNGIVFLFIVSALTAFAWYYYKNEGRYTPMVQGLFNANIFTLFMWILRQQTRIAERPSYYFLVISCALYAYMLHYYRRDEIIVYGILTLAYLLFAYRLVTNFASIIPYNTF